jgi:chemotaxis protein MotB
MKELKNVSIMKNVSIFSVLTVALLLTSCAPMYQCGDAVPEKTGMASKRLKTVVSERDSLCTTLGSEQADNAALRADIAKLKDEQKDLQSRYAKLSDEKMADAAQFDAALRQKADELNQKEKLLAEREKSLREMQKVIARQDSITQRLNDILRNALLGFNSDELSVEIRNGKVYVSMSDKLLFKSGSAAVEAKGKEAIKLLGEVLVKNQDIDILIEGHTDNVPIKTANYKDNWDLSVARATSIVRILTDDHKVTPTRLTASGKGEFLPRESNDTAEGRARNRRTEIILSPKLDEIMQLLNK